MGALIANHHDFIFEQRPETEVEREIKELEERHRKLEADISAIHVDEANQQKADELRQSVEELEGELAHHQQSRKG
jgi:septal ring factor EnvC (AmiA/AmiB activator)